MGMLFFGVPNRGMDIESLQAIVCDRQNRYLLESVGQYSDLLLEQDGQFGPIFHFKDSPIVSFYETESSSTAIEVSIPYWNNLSPWLSVLGEWLVEDGRSSEDSCESLLSNLSPPMGVRRRRI